MKKFKSTNKKLLSVILAIIMVVSVIPMSMFSITASAVSGSEIVAYARQFIGYPYVYGTQGPNSFDCSGFVQYVFKHFGISLPASSSSYWKNPTAYGTVVGSGSTANAKAGDVISWSGHVAIYTENGKCVEALNPSYGVTESVPVNSHTNGTNYKVIRINGVTDDTTKPTISNVHLSNVSGGSFTINCTLNDNVAMSRVWFNIYATTASGYIEDGYSVSASNGNFSHTISTSKYGGAGTYTVHMYAIDTSENSTRYAIEKIYAMTDTEKPTISNTRITDVSDSSFTINCTLNDNVAMSRVWFNIYANTDTGYHEDGYSVSASNGAFSHTINTSKYGGAGRYTVHMYAIDTSENSTRYAIDPILAYNSYIITYNPNGGSVSPTSNSVSAGGSVTLPKPTKSYKLTYNANGGSGAPSAKSLSLVCNGWSTSSSATSASYSCGESYKPTGNVTLYAVWKSSIMTTVSSTQPTRAGYKFLGWSKNSNATTPTFKVGDTISLTANTTLYAVWEKLPDATTYKLSFNANGGSGAPSAKTGATSYSIPSTVPTREGYKFLGWSKNSNVTTPTYKAGNTISLTNNTTLYAVWEKLPVGTEKGITDVAVNNKYLYYNEISKLVIKMTGEDCDYEIEYASSDDGIATVSEDGYVYANGRGVAEITVTVTDEYGNIVEDVCYVEVTFAWYQWLIYIFLLGFLWY